MDIRVIPKFKVAKVEDLQDAYNQGLFNGSMSRWELEDRVTKYNPSLRIQSNATHRGLFDGNSFVCGIGHDLTIPRFTLIRYVGRLHRTITTTDEYGNKTGTQDRNTDPRDGVVLMRAWPEIMRMVAKQGYEIDLSNL